MKSDVVRGMIEFIKIIFRIFGRIPLIPLGAKLWLTDKRREFRFLIPPNKELVYDRYLGDLRVNINTLYPIELEMLTGEYDPCTSRVIGSFLQRGCVAADIGANVGALTMLMAKLVGKDGIVLAVEPGPPIFSRLVNNLELNPEIKSRVRTVQMGLSDRKDELFWCEDPKNRGNAGFLDGYGIPVSVITLDELVTGENVTRLDFVKIDVEGMELEVIKGGTKTLQKYKPVIYYETLVAFRQHRGFDIFGEIAEILRSMDYRLFGLDLLGNLKNLENLDDLPRNTLALPKEKAQETYLAMQCT
jgi:FkbM family methyltransferase